MEIELYKPNPIAASIYTRDTDPVGSAVKLGKPYALMFALSNEAHGVAIAYACTLEGLTPFQLMRTYDFVNGRLRKKSLAVYAEFQSMGGSVEWLNTGEDGKEARAIFKYKDQKPIEGRYTIEDARRQGLVKPGSNWEKTPANMLRARLLSNYISILCPSIVAGVSGLPEDSEGDTASSAATLNLSGVAPKPEAKAEAQPAAPAAPKPEVKEAKIIDVEQVQDTAPAPTLAAAPAPQATATPATTAEPAQTAQELPAEVLTQVEQAIGDHALPALRWMRSQGWLKENEGLANLSPTKATRIIKQRDSFIRAITATAAK